MTDRLFFFGVGMRAFGMEQVWWCVCACRRQQRGQDKSRFTHCSTWGDHADATLTRHRRSRALLEMGLEPTISSLGGRRLIH